jgi:hypothetical protein
MGDEAFPRELLHLRALDIALLAHDLFGNRHLRGKVRILRSQPRPIGRFHKMQRIPRHDPRTGEQFLGQGDIRGMADGGR